MVKSIIKLVKLSPAVRFGRLVFIPSAFVKLNREKKTLRTENRIILTFGSFGQRSPKRVALIINI